MTVDLTVGQFWWTTAEEERIARLFLETQCQQIDPASIMPPGLYRVIDGDIYRVVDGIPPSLREVT